MKKFLILLAVLATILGTLAACGGSKPAETPATGEPAGGTATGTSKDTIVLRLGENQPADYPTTLGDLEFARLVEERTDGRIKIEVYYGGQLGDEKSVIEQVQFGAIDFVRTSISPLSEFAKELNVLQLPYIYRDEEHQWAVLNGEIGDQLLESVDQANMVGLTWYDSGSRNFYNTKKEVKSMADLQGMKIRVQESKLMMGLVQAVGASPTPMPYGEVYSALQTGVIDGAENNLPSYVSSSHYEVAKYITMDGHTRVPEIVVASKDTMNKLSAEDQEIIRQAAKDSQALQREEWAKYTEESRQTAIDAGCVITELDAGLLSEFQAAVQPLYADYAEYAELIQKIQDTK
ncbi:TRAP transporter substrate-binding protein [Anaerotalea alkaliphila]|uniref:TRAP transporter substrate-binding protein n=1 Tax=Anaerotalea alkaliphila TaxID=2662126 RepID=A0A7X5HYA6_9FIRM|nr:TRAP transporter substrate-binding protein [Anaerotalea alkaliphila]NDL68857.1 TRAP transporter substrate-binding protein [Anaerotalea alkaliphila]